MNTPPENAFAAVVVHFGAVEATQRCVESLLASRLPPARVFVVDHDGAWKAGQGTDSDFDGAVTVLRDGINHGFGAGANRGVRAALDGGFLRIFLINNDAWVERETTARLREISATHPTPGAIWAPVIVQARAPFRIWSAGGSVSAFFTVPKNPYYGRSVDEAPVGVRWVTFLSGCALWFEAQAWTAVGGFDERMFLYAEDVDWCLRALRAGLGLGVLSEPGCRVYHVGGSGGGDDRVALYHLTRNLKLAARKHLGVMARIAWWGYFLARWVGYMALRHLLKGRMGNIAALLRGLAASTRE